MSWQSCWPRPNVTAGPGNDAERNEPALNDAANSFSTDHYRKLVNELRQALAARAEAERLLAADQAPEDALSPLRFERRLQALDDEFQRAAAAADEEQAAARQALDDEHQSTVAAIRVEYGRTAARIESDFNAGL